MLAAFYFMNKLENEKAALLILEGANFKADPEVFLENLIAQGWDIYPVKYRNEVIGGIIEKDGDIHTSIAPEFQKRWNPRPYIKKILYPAILKYGVVRSFAPKNDERCFSWLTRLGFNVTHEDEENIYLEITLETLRF